MDNTISELNIENGLTVQDITTDSITTDTITSNNALFNSLRTNTLYCKNVELDISQNLNLSGSLSSLNLATNILSCNSINANLITRTSDNSRFATLRDISDCYDSIIDGAPGALNTLKEIASSINNEVSFSTMMFGRLNLVDNSYNTIINPKLNNHDTSLNTINTTVNNLTTTVNTKISNEINQDVFLTGNLYIKPTNKFLTFLNSTNNAMSSLITRSDFTLFNNVSSLVSGGFSFAVDNITKLNINNNGDINMFGSINATGGVTCSNLTFTNVPTVNHIQRGIASPSLNGSYRVQFSKVFPSQPSVTATPIYAGTGYMISVLLTAVDTSGFNFRVIARSATGSMEFFEQYCQVSWIAIG